MLEKIILEGSLKASGIVGIFPAYAEQDDITVFNPDRSEVIGTLYGLRQQV